jgi:hypothetical protein
MDDEPQAAPAPYPATALDPRAARLRIGLAVALGLLAAGALIALRAAPAPDDAALPLRGAIDARTGQRAAAPR